METGLFYIDGEWVRPLEARGHDVIDPATEQPVATISLGGGNDVDRAVAAARRAFPGWAATPVEERARLTDRICDIYQRRAGELAEAVRSEMGAPITLARSAHVPAGLGHLRRAAEELCRYAFDERVNATTITREPIGVCGLITPWNWPLNQIACKVGPALAAGCTIVLKPSELSPLDALIFAEIVDEAGAPPGVFNLVNGDGPGVGAAIAAHPDIDMVSFTGSTRAGVLVAKAAADTVKRVAQELGGKSPSLVLDDADLDQAVRHTATFCFRNSGQSCNAPTRLLVPRARLEEAVAIAADHAASLVAGDTKDEATSLGPIANKAQYARVQAMIERGLAEAARLAAGGPGRPEGIDKGYYARPTVFADVSPDMAIAREEIFGPVLSVIPYDDEAQAIAIANDSVYGLSAYVASADPERAGRVARRLRAGMVHINGARGDNAAAFGGYKQSGNGREWGRYGLEEYLEVKSMFGYPET